MSHRQVTNILFFNHNVIFLINYKSVIFLCFICQKWFCLHLGSHNLAIALQFRRFVNQGWLMIRFITSSEDDSCFSPSLFQFKSNEQSVDMNSFSLVWVMWRGHLKFNVNGISNPPAGIGDGLLSIDFTVPSI